MRLRLPPGLHYPITVAELLKKPTDDVATNEALFEYHFKGFRKEDDYLGETRTVEKLFPGVFESEVEGTFRSWLIDAGQVIRGPLDVAEVEEPCTHEIQYHGICAMCGKDMTQLNYNKRSKDTSRAAINMVHDDVNLKISSNEASRSEQEAKRRLILSKRLSLVVDLDQTIIHATVDPTVGEWQQDPSNPNHAAVADVQSFQLTDDGPGSRACWYYIKTRPGLQKFLDSVSKLFELHIYTMGTRAYAQQIAKIVDPERTIFGDRILSRDESGSLTVKNLQRLFPIDTKMVVIIDDRGDVWKWNENLIKVTPYDFFVGIGDINSSYLPQKPKILSTPKEEVVGDARRSEVNGSANGVPHNGLSSALDQLVSMSGGGDPDKLKDQTEKAAQAIDDQVEQRPLLQKQKALDKADEDVGSELAEESDSAEKQRHHLLEDHDNELRYLERSLTQVHQEFYDEYYRRLPEQVPKPTIDTDASVTEDDKVKSVPDLTVLPDIKSIMPLIKRRVLEGVSIVFSGVVPMGVNISASDIAIWAKSFGARVGENVSRSRTTHVVAARKGTAKVKKAMRYGRGRIKVVGTQWLMDSIVRWKRQDEKAYLLHSEADEISPADPRTGIEEDDADVLSESEEPVGEDAGLTDGEITDGERERQLKGVQLRLDTVPRHGDEEEVAVDVLGVSPDTPFDDKSPIANAADWQDIEDEMADFLDGVSDSDSEDGAQAALPSRKRPSEEDEEDEDGRSQGEGEHPRKRVRDNASKGDVDARGALGNEAEAEDDGFEEDFEKAWDEGD